MSTTHHDPHAFGADLSSAELNRPLGELDAALEETITTGSGATTTLTAQANSGQPNLVVASVAGLAVGDIVYIGRAGDAYESGEIDSIVTLTVTLTANLANTYASGKPVSKSPIELVDARGGESSLGSRLDKMIGGLDDRGTGLFSIPDAATKRMPVNLGVDMVGPDIIADGGSSNVIGVEFSPRFTGDFTGITGADAGFVWGLNEFMVIGPAAVDGNGITQATAFLAEMALTSPSADISVVRAMHADCSFFGAAAGGTVSVMESLRVTPPPVRKARPGASLRRPTASSSKLSAASAPTSSPCSPKAAPPVSPAASTCWMPWCRRGR